MEIYELSGSGENTNGLAITGITLKLAHGPLAFMNPDKAPNPSPSARVEAASHWTGLRVVAEQAKVKRKPYLRDAIGPGFSFPGCSLAVSDHAKEILEPILGDQVIFLDLDVVHAPFKYWGFYATQYYDDLDEDLCVLEEPYDSAPDRRMMMRQVGFKQTERLEALYVFRVPGTERYTPPPNVTFATQKFLDLVVEHNLGGFSFLKNYHKGFRLPPGEKPVLHPPGPKYPLVMD
jgi:hypothetical protein